MREQKTIELYGMRYNRIKYGDEKDRAGKPADWGANVGPCSDCGVKKVTITSSGAMWNAALAVVANCLGAMMGRKRPANP